MGGMDRIHPAQDRDQWWALANTVMNLFGFHKMLGSSWVAAQMSAPQEGLSSMELVKDAVSSSNNIASNGRIIMNWNESGRNLFGLIGGTVLVTVWKDGVKPWETCQDSRGPGRDSNSAHSVYTSKSEAFPAWVNLVDKTCQKNDGLSSRST
jgi:hypothetical protein